MSSFSKSAELFLSVNIVVTSKRERERKMRGMTRTTEEWKRLFLQLGVYGPDIRCLNTDQIGERPDLMDEAAGDLTRIMQIFKVTGTIHRVVGPAMGAITLAHDLARKINCATSYAEVAKEGDKILGMKFRRNRILPGERILVCDDVFTDERVSHMVKLIKAECGVVLPFVVVLVNQSGLKDIDGLKIVSLIN